MEELEQHRICILRYKLFIVLILLISCESNETEEMRLFISSLSSEESSTPKVKVYFMLGQSNSLGAALNSDATSLELEIKPNCQTWQRDIQDWESLDIPSNNNYSQGAAYHGFELALSNYHPDPLIYLGKYGLGSTSIDRHIPPSGDLYYNAKNLVIDPVLANLTAQGIEYEVYMCWWQGEEDALTLESANAYPPKFDIWVDTWKTNLGSDLKFRIYEIGANSRPPENVAIINGTFNDKALIEPNMEVISNNGTGSTHFTYAQIKTMTLDMISKD